VSTLKQLDLGVDATWLVHDQRGMGRFVRSMLTALSARTDVRLTLASRDPADEAALRSLLGDGAWTFVRWGDPALKARDVCWFPWNRVDLRLACPVVVTIHDTAAFDWPVRRLLGLVDNWRAQGQLRQAVARATRVMTVSEFSARCIRKHLAVEQARLDVISEGVDTQRFFPLDPEATSPSDDAAARQPNVLFVGALDPRKNLAGLLQAWQHLGAAAQSWTLYIAGCDEAAVRKALPLPLPPRVRFLGTVADAQLPALYQQADLFVMPSFYEGFGLPVLEAMACGTPVAASTGGSLPEVSGEAAVVTFDPASPPAMAEALGVALRRVGSQRAALRAQSVAHAAAFTWERAAEQALASFYRALQ
jgi:glycosyltransferase involved in cell wall biosynthesis